MSVPLNTEEDRLESYTGKPDDLAIAKCCWVGGKFIASRLSLALRQMSWDHCGPAESELFERVEGTYYGMLSVAGERWARAHIAQILDDDWTPERAAAVITHLRDITYCLEGEIPNL
jgi:hypothetical protein